MFIYMASRVFFLLRSKKTFFTSHWMTFSWRSAMRSSQSNLDACYQELYLYDTLKESYTGGRVRSAGCSTHENWLPSFAHFSYEIRLQDFPWIRKFDHLRYILNISIRVEALHAWCSIADIPSAYPRNIFAYNSTQTLFRVAALEQSNYDPAQLAQRRRGQSGN